MYTSVCGLFANYLACAAYGCMQQTAYSVVCFYQIIHCHLFLHLQNVNLRRNLFFFFGFPYLRVWPKLVTFRLSPERWIQFEKEKKNAFIRYQWKKLPQQTLIFTKSLISMQPNWFMGQFTGMFVEHVECMCKCCALLLHNFNLCKTQFALDTFASGTWIECVIQTNFNACSMFNGPMVKQSYWIGMEWKYIDTIDKSQLI